MSIKIETLGYEPVSTHPTTVELDKAIQIGPIDFYLCPKCATNTLRYASYAHNTGDKREISEYREDGGDSFLKLKNKKISYLKERSDSIKVAVIRDPVERFVSAHAWHNYKYFSARAARLKRKFSIEIEEFIGDMKIPNDIHFYPQTEFYGDPTKYDLMIRPNQIVDLLKEHGLADYDDLHYGKTRIEYAKLTDSQIDIVKDMYEVDYKNGYC